jgi:hypothetical protein
MNSFQESLTVNCFFNAKNGKLHQTLTPTHCGKPSGLMNGQKSNRRRANPASKVCEIFHDFGAVNVVNKFYCFWVAGRTPHFRIE